MAQLTTNQLILLTLKAISHGSKRARDLSSQQFEITRNKLRRMGYLWYSYSDKQWYINEKGERLLKDMQERVTKEIIGGNN